MTTQLAPTPVFKAFDNNGSPLANGLLYSYIAGTTTPQATYTDSTGGTPNTNPVVLNARGEANVWLNPTQGYKLVLTDSLGNQVWSVDGIIGSININQSLIPAADNTYSLGSPAAAWAQLYLGANHTPVLNNGVIGYWPQTAAELAAGVTPATYSYQPGDLRRYGGDPTGVADSTTALSNAIAQCAQATGAPVIIPSGTFMFAGTTIALASNVHIIGAGSSSVLNFESTANNDFISGNGIANASVRGLKINIVNAQAGGNYIGAVAFHANCTNCSVSDCEITGVTSTGVLLDGSSYCHVARNYFHGFNYGTGVNDSSDIHLMVQPTSTNAFNCEYNIIEANECFGGNNIGISIETSATPDNLMRKNLIIGNRVGTHTAYGIICYSHQTGDTYNQVIGNYIENISGTSSSQGGTTGAGIYTTMSGVKIANNSIVNCCTATSASGLAPGGIGINAPVGAPVEVTGNSIFDMAQGNATAGLVISGIYVANAPAGSNITGNTISQQVAGGITAGIYIGPGVTGLNICGNLISILNTIAGTRGILIYAASANISNLALTGNTLAGSAYAGIQTIAAGAYLVSNVTVQGNSVTGMASAGVPLYLTSLQQSSVAGNLAQAAGAQALYVNGCTTVRIAGNNLQTTGATLITCSGTNSDVLIDETNSGLASGNVNNSVAGCTVRYRGTAIPTGGYAQVGDTVFNTAPGATTEYLWVCTGSGTPGTWTALTLP